jgi:hypothetical protein
MSGSTKKRHSPRKPVPENTSPGVGPWKFLTILAVLVGAGVLFYLLRSPSPPQQPLRVTDATQALPEIRGWTERALAVSRLFHKVYTPCWEGAYGAIGDAYLFALTGDSSLFRFHILHHDMRKMCDGTWVDDEAWVCLAELKWWEITGKSDTNLVLDAMRRYKEVREEGRLSNHEGFWTWYNWPPGARVSERIFTNSNMNQMATVACGLYQATGDRAYLRDALLVWQGDGKLPGIKQQWYRGKGVWEGRPGRAAFGKELPWDGLGCVPLVAALYRATRQKEYRQIAVATARRILDPSTGWVDSTDFYQMRMDGNGAFVNFLFDAYAIAPTELAEVPQKVERMLEHVWTNHHGSATVTLHRLTDHGIRNGWNPRGGEDGYGVGEIGTVHAQGEAVRAFGVFAYYAAQRSPPHRIEQ